MISQPKNESGWKPLYFAERLEPIALRENQWTATGNVSCEAHHFRCASCLIDQMSELLIITNSYDVTTDLLLDRLARQSVFRLNFDQLSSYRVRIDNGGFNISDPTGRRISSETVKKAYWRKPFNWENDEQKPWTKYVDAEMRYVLTEISNLLWAQQKLVLVEPFAEKRTGKLLQLQLAQNQFLIPAYEFVLNHESRISNAIVKSLSGEPVGDKVLYATKTRTEELDPSFPWFVEQLVEGKQDVTVVFVRGKIFAFQLERDFLDKSIDWRQFISPEQKWKSHEIPTSLRFAIDTYMKVLRLDYGRLDFLLDDNHRYWFCEVNPNGQFAWLDLDGDFGVLEAITQEISPATEVHPLPLHHPLEHIRD
jgi:hypothetical protein